MIEALTFQQRRMALSSLMPLFGGLPERVQCFCYSYINYYHNDSGENFVWLNVRYQVRVHLAEVKC